MDNKKQEAKLKLISDEPSFGPEKDSSQADAFNHEAVANVLYAMIESNPAPLTVGIYGGWGVGKSSIVNLLKRKCKGHLVIEFNAWRYSGDSFRRQFLIATVEGLLQPDHPERAIALEEIRKLNYAKTLEEEAGIAPYPDLFGALFTKEGWARLGAEVRNDWRNVRPARGGLIRTLFSGIFAGIGLILWIFGSDQMQSWGVISFLVSAGNFLAPKVDNLFVSKKREVFDAKLIFPEQFEEEFSKLIAKHRKNRKVVVIIDDLDRCDGQTIKDVLITLKNFLGRKECYFFVPMDDSSVVEAIKETNKGSNSTNFNYEQLRKYFNVFVRIPAISETDILAFAQRVAEKYGVRADVALIGANGHCRDARKIKHFLNLFLVKRALLEERRLQNYLNIKDEEMDEVELELSRLAVLEYQHPTIYAKLAMNPAFFSELLRAAMETNYKSDLLQDFLVEIGEESPASLWKNEPNL